MFKEIVIWFLALLTSASTTNLYITCDEPFDRSYVNPQCTISNIHADYTTKFNFTGFNYIFFDTTSTRTSYKHQIKKVEFKASVLKNFPIDLFTTFVNLNDFTARDSGVIEVCRHFFQNGGELIKIDLSGNLIELLPNVAFMGADKLQVLDLSLNQIAEIQTSAFHELPHLSTLKLSYNRITTMLKDYFQDLYYLDKIYLDHNRIATLSKDTFARCPSLRYLWLNDNQLQVLGDLEKVGQMRYVDLRSNLLETLDWRNTVARTLDVTNNSLTWVYIPSGMEYLFAGSNRISTIEVASTELNIWEINLAKNNISTLENITKLATMGVADLSFNNIGALSMSTFAAMPELQTLNLEATNLSNIQYGTFSHLKKIKTLDISYNNLTNLDPHMFSAMSELENFYVDGNNLTDLEYQHVHDYFPNLTFIGLSDNPFNCTYLSRVMKALKTLNISVYIDPKNIVTNESNVMGVGCWNEKIGERHMQLDQPRRHLNLDDTQGEEAAIALNETFLSRYYKTYREDEVDASAGAYGPLLAMNIVLIAIIIGFGAVKAMHYIKKRKSNGIISFNTRSNSVLTIEQNI